MSCTLIVVNSTQPEKSKSKAYTPKKGHATPSRKQAQAKVGTFSARYTPAESYGESRKRRKELKASMSKEEWKHYRAEEKAASKERRIATQKAMDSGDERYLMERDKGKERAFVRDFVDSKRHMNTYIMPFALVLLLIMSMGSAFPTLANATSTVAMVIMLFFIIEGVLLGRRAVNATRERFPETSERGLSLGFYAYGRASQPRRWRTPKPRVSIGDTV